MTGMENYTKRDGDSALSDNCRQPPFKKPMNNNPGKPSSCLLRRKRHICPPGLFFPRRGSRNSPAWRNPRTCGRAGRFPVWPLRIPHLGIFPMRTAHLRLYPCRRTHLRHQGHLPRLPCSCMEPQAALPRPFLAGGRLPQTSCRTPYAMPAPFPAPPPQAPT